MEHDLAEIIDNVATTGLKEDTDFCCHEEIKEVINHLEIMDHNYCDNSHNLSERNLVQFEDSTTDLKKEQDCSFEEVEEKNNCNEFKDSCINIGKSYCDESNVTEISLEKFESAINAKEKSLFCFNEETKYNGNHMESDNSSINVDVNDKSNSQKLPEKNVMHFQATTDKVSECISIEVQDSNNISKLNLNNIASERVIDSVVHNIECEASKHDKNSEFNEADQLEIEAEDEGLISDGIFTDEIIIDSEDSDEIVECKKSKIKAKKQSSLCKEDEEMQDLLNDDVEEGEVKDDTTIPNCRFFAWGHCMFGSACKNMHVTDKGLYQMFELSKKDSCVRPMRRHNARPDFVSLPLDVYVRNCLPPAEPEFIEFRDLAWERGLRLAKQQQKKALERKNDPDFDEKYFYMNVKESPSRKRRRSFEKHPSKTSYSMANRTSGDHRKKHKDTGNAIYEKKRYNIKSQTHQKENNYENDTSKKRKISGETEWRDPWRRSKSPISKIRSRSHSLSSSYSCSSSYCSSQCSCHSRKHLRESYISKKKASTKIKELKDSKSKHLESSKGGRSCSRSSSRSLSSSPTEVLKFREHVYRNKPVTSFESNSQQKLKEGVIKSSNINNYKPPFQKEIHKMYKSRKSTSPNKRYRRSTSQSSSCHSYRTRSRSSCSTASYCSKSNSCTSNYSSRSYTRQNLLGRREISKYSFTLKDELNKRASLHKSKSITKSLTPRRTAQSPELRNKLGMPKLSFKFLPKTTGKSISSDVPKWLSNVVSKSSTKSIGKMSNIISSKETVQNGAKTPVGLKVKKASAKTVVGKSGNMLLRYQDLAKRNKESGENSEILKSLNQKTTKGEKQITKNENAKPTTLKIDTPKATLSMKSKTPVDKCAPMLLRYHDLAKHCNAFMKNTVEAENSDGCQGLQTPINTIKLKKFNESKNIPVNNNKEKIAFNEPRKISQGLRKKEMHPLGSKNLNVAALDIERKLSKPQIIPNKAMQRSKSHITMNLITDVSQHHNLRSVSRKPMGPSTMFVASNKPSLKESGGSRRDILLKQLKAIEDAIARKRSK